LPPEGKTRTRAAAPVAEVEAAAAGAGLGERSLLAATDALGERCRRGERWLPG